MRSVEELESLSPAALELGRCRRQLKFLEEIVRATASGTPRDVLLHAIVDKATEATGTQVCSIYLWSTEERVLILNATNGLSQRHIGQVKIPLGEGVTGWVGAQRQPLAVRDVNYDPRFNRIAGFDQPEYISMLSVPVLAQEQLIGVVNVQTVAAHNFSADEVEFLSALAAEIASIVQLADSHDSLARELVTERSAAARLLDLSGACEQTLSAALTEFRMPLSTVALRLNTLAQLVDPQEMGLIGGIREELAKIHESVDGLLAVLSHLPRTALSVKARTSTKHAHTHSA